MSKPTPGPWQLATSNSWRRFVGHDGRSVCEPVTYSEKDRHPDLYFRNGGEDGPDARLIAAAPELLAALSLAQRLCKEALPKFNWSASALDADAIRLLNEAGPAIDAAILKATGEGS